MKKLISPDIRLIGVPLVAIVSVLLIALTTFKPTYYKIKESINTFRQATTAENQLAQKINSLKVVEGEVLSKTDVSLIALPNTNPSPWLISQLKNGAIESGVILEEIGLSDKGGEGINEVGIGFSLLSPNMDSLISYLQYIRTITPLCLIDSYSISNGEQIEVSMGLSTYFSDLPTVLPAITDPVNDLTQKEDDILTLISALKRPDFNTLEPAQPAERPVPFN